MITAIILAAGKGTRIKSKINNKVTLPFLNKPMILYGVELLEKVCDQVVVVAGAFAQSVKKVLKSHKVIYAYQKKQLGTAHAVKMALDELKRRDVRSDLFLVGYGDHMMFYSVKNASDLIKYHNKENAIVTIVTTVMDDTHKLGRIVRDSKTKSVLRVIEEKDATEDEKEIKEINAGLYCFDADFLINSLPKIKQSPVTKEYYLTDLIQIANKSNKKVAGLIIPFENVGIGINRLEELNESQKIYVKYHNAVSDMLVK
jgi:bifunctional UDP-N-acetylglucosamine pyrophosphorylase/glucosamine-1-phosphate N-acetyltransferase